MKSPYKKIMKIIGAAAIIAILLLFAILCIFQIVFVLGVWYQDYYM